MQLARYLFSIVLLSTLSLVLRADHASWELVSFFDDFNRADANSPGSQWKTTQGGFVLRRGVSYGTERLNLAFPRGEEGTIEASNMKLVLDISNHNAEGQVELMVRRYGGDFYNAVLQVNSNGTGALSLRRRIGNDYIVLARAPLTDLRGRWEVSAEDRLLSVRRNDIQLLSYEDSELSFGMAAIRTMGTTIGIDNVKIYSKVSIFLSAYQCVTRDSGWNEEHYGGHSALGLTEAVARAAAFSECLSFHGKCHLVQSPCQVVHGSF